MVCVLKDVEKLRSMNLALGGSLENAVVLDDTKILNNDGLRFSDEFVRHKVLDFIGDMSIMGQQLKGNFMIIRPSHHGNCEFLKSLCVLYEGDQNFLLVNQLNCHYFLTFIILGPYNSISCYNILIRG